MTIGTVTFESAGYVARYCMKKINGPKAEEINEETQLKHYERINSFTGEIHSVLPEYATMSTNRGIGYSWISTYTRDCYPKDFTTIRGIRMRPARYYDRYIEAIDPWLYDDIKAGRQLKANELSSDNTEQRLEQREIVKAAQFKQLIRSL